MVDETNTAVYDPDAPPESTFITKFVGQLVTNVMVSEANVHEQPEHVQKSVNDYWDAASNRRPIWFLEAHGISVRRTDGQPFRQSDIISLQDKNGRWLSKGMTPDAVATQYRGCESGMTVSYTQNGSPHSALNRIFEFEAHEMTFRGKAKGRKKVISLWPNKVFPVGYQYDGEIIEVEPSSSNDDGAAPSAAPSYSNDQVTTMLRAALTGKSKSEMFDAVMESTELRSVGKAFGVSLMEAATDESLAGVLVENGVFVLDADGKFQVPA